MLSSSPIWRRQDRATLVNMTVTRTIRLRGSAVPPSALAWKLEQNGVDVQPWEPSEEGRGLATEIVSAIVAAGAIEAIKAAVADFRKTFPRAHVEIEGHEEDRDDEDRQEGNGPEPPESSSPPASSPPELDYRQLADILRHRISAGEWRGDPLPSASQLRQEYNVDRKTVIRATELLKDEGLLYTVPNRGVYVTPQD